ncbi:MAG: nitroreductase family protein [Promethearchaeota archaeon]
MIIPPQEFNDWNETLRVIHKRRSVRAYASTPIPEEIKNQIIHATMRAPTAGNLMLYSILEVRDQNKKAQLVKTCDNQPFIAKAPLVLIFLADQQRMYDFYTTSGVPSLCDQKGVEFRTPAASDLLLASCDALIAAQTAVLAAESLGIGSCYIGDVMENIETHRAMFNLPPWVFPTTMVCFGYPKKETFSGNLNTRFNQKYIHFVDSYRQLQKQDFQEMYDHQMTPGFHAGDFPLGAANLAHLYYLRKTGSEFSEEMARSVNVALDSWK